MKVAIAVQGRFHAFDLASGMMKAGHDATLITNYPGPVMHRFDVGGARVLTVPTHGIATRLAERIRLHGAEPVTHRWFGRAVARRLGREPWDLTHVWSGVAEEWLKTDGARNCLLGRHSTHIREQRNLLEEEEERTGISLEKPSDWMIEREEREYALAPLIAVPARFCADSFKLHHVEPDRVCTIRFATEAPYFRTEDAVVTERLRRIEAGEPLRVLYVGTVSYRKGMYDFAKIVVALSGEPFQIRIVGPIQSECAQLARDMAQHAEVMGSHTREQLRSDFAWGDVLVLPSIEDGQAIVLSQAAAAGLPFIGSTHSGAPDLLELGSQGWSLPPRDPGAWTELLMNLERDRAALLERVHKAKASAARRTWTDVARDMVEQTTRKLKVT